MSSEVIYHQAHDYAVQTPIYSGPLDLLLQLVERAELDITRLALAQVTDQYLQHLRQMEQTSPDEVSAFLVIAARLIQIKSETLLPRPPAREEGEEDPGEALVQQLILYKKYKQVASFLENRQAAGVCTYLRLAEPVRLGSPASLEGVTLAELWQAALAIFGQPDQFPALTTVVAAPRVTIRQKISLIVAALRGEDRVRFLDLIRAAHSRLDVVVTFLAMLELIKQQRITIRQEQVFGEIEIARDTAWADEAEIELEFGE
jgi:segregation and condensation protein A